MKCKRCQECFIKLEADAVSVSCTMLPIDIFQDEFGKHHVHDPNRVVTRYVCTFKHVWDEVESRSCWCGWSVTRPVEAALGLATTRSEPTRAPSKTSAP